MNWLELLGIIEGITWEGEGKKYDDDGNDCKVGVIKLQKITKEPLKRLGRLLIILMDKKLISKSILFTGANKGYFATPLGHATVSYLGDKK